jgi:hypothetical protein
VALKLGDNNILFVINSNIRFHNAAGAKAIHSLNKAGIYDIKVIIGGAGKEEDDGHMHYTTYDSCDYTTFNYILDYPDKFKDYTHIFYMHDTCWVGKDFKKLFEELTPKSQVKGYLLTEYPSMNIGLYKIQDLVDSPDRVRRSLNTDNSPEGINKAKQWGAENEDYLNAKNGIYCPISTQQITYDTPYNTTKTRRIRYFPTLDFYKAQSNYDGVKDQMNVEL